MVRLDCSRRAPKPSVDLPHTLSKPCAFHLPFVLTTESISHYGSDRRIRSISGARVSARVRMSLCCVSVSVLRIVWPGAVARI